MMDRPASALDGPAAEGIGSGFLAALPREAADRLLAEGIRINVPAGALIYRDDESPRVIVVLNGLLRVFLTSSDGRQVTVRYARSGDVAGLVLVIGGPAPMSIQAMVGSLVVALRVDSPRAMLATDPRVARACAEELTAQLHHLLEEIPSRPSCRSAGWCASCSCSRRRPGSVSSLAEDSPTIRSVRRS
jgi:CRP/FNR family transcriptional regulator